MTDEYLPDLAHWEGVYGYMYLDTKGLVTTAIGHLLAAPSSALALPFGDTSTGAEATDAAKLAAWSTVSKMVGAKKESTYASATTLRLTEPQCFDLARARLDGEFLPALRLRLPGFDSFPATIRRALVDVAWNYGIKGMCNTHLFWPAVTSHNWKRAREVAMLLSSRPERNRWRAQMFAGT